MKIMSTLLFLSLAVLCFLWMAETRVTFSPFTFEMLKPYKAIGFTCILVGIMFLENQAGKTAVNDFKIELINELEKSKQKEVKIIKDTTDGSK
jgi:hypothetical protein